MPSTLRVLIVEDSENDATHILQELRRSEWEVTHERVDTPAGMSAALDKPGWDLIIADYSMPHFSGTAALALAARRADELPCILVSGALGEEMAVQAIKAGGDDYLFKGNLSRLVPAVERELHKADGRRKAKRIEKELRQRETQLADALQLARIGTWHLDMRTNMVVWSEEACRIIGFKGEPASPSFEEFLGRLGPEDRTLVRDILWHPAAKHFSQDLQLTCTNGTVQFVHIRGEIRQASDSMPLEAIGMIQDITKQKGVETELSVQRARFQTTLSSIGDAVIVTDPESRITFMNPTAEKLTGWSYDESLQKPLADVFNIVNEQSSRAVPNPVTKAIRDGVIVGLANHTVLIARDGTEWPIDDSAAPICDAEGHLVGVVLVFHDITNRRKAEHELEISEVRYRRLFESAHDGILILDALTAVVLDVNRYMVDLLGHSREHFLGKELWQIGVFKDAEGSRVAMKILQKVGKIRYEDLPLEHKDGRHIPVEFVSNVYREGRRPVIQCNIRDITERKRVDRELAKAKEDAEAANRSKSEFLANMSHEIRTPMSAILGFANMLMHNHIDDLGRLECIQIIQRNALHLLELINEILDLSKIEALEMKIERIPCDIPVLLSDVVSLMRPRALEKRLGFEVAFEGPIPRLIQTDPTRLRQILVNLLGNAVKFTSAGKIGIRISDEGSGSALIALRIDVIDSGIGMTPEQLSRLFWPFTQGDESITRKFGGTGLGLTISRRLARLLNGDISVKSEIDIGSTFTLKIDGGGSEGVEMLVGMTEAALPVQAAGAVHHNIVLKGRILLVEDGHDNMRLLGMQLRDAGADVSSATNGQIAVDLATTQPFDVILMDLQMPVMDGYAATAELRRRGLKVPIIALTAYAMAEDRAKCIASGCDDYLSKPVSEETLLKTVNQHLGHTSTSTPGNGAEGGAGSQSQSPADDGHCAIKSSLADNPRMQAIIPEFVDGLPEKVRDMIEMLQRNDLPSLQKVVHQLRGAGGGYGFEPVTEPATRAEDAIRAGNALTHITAEINSLIEVIRRIEGYDQSRAPITTREITK